MYYVYVLKSVNFKRFYVGLTTDIDRRLTQHNSGRTKSIKAYTPFLVIYFETFKDRQEARNREKYFKSAAGRKYLVKIGIKYWSRSSMDTRLNESVGRACPND